MNYAEMSSKNLLETLNDIDEQDTLEAKSLRDDSSRSILETVCSFSNEPGLGGGVILIGVAESKDADGPRYVVDGVEDPDKAQLNLATQCKSVFNSAVYPTIKVEKIGRKKVLKIVVDELPASRKPLYFKKDGLPRGAYRRIGSADLVATEEDLWRFYEDPESKYDETPVKYSSLADVDERAVQRYRQMRKKVDPDAVELGYKTPELLAALGCTSRENPQELNMAGMLLFGKELAIKRACARARVDYIRILGTDWLAVADQFDAVDTYAPIFLMVDKLMSIIYGELPTRHRFHRDSIQPETEKFPVEVMREAIVNMLMHRDYRHGQFTQIIRYDNRIEICNSGCSLKPDDMLGMKGSVTRNDTIARVCHDAKLAETKGSGIERMWRKMVEAGLSRPTMESDRTAATFTIRLLLCHFFSEETLDWLRRFAPYELNDDQRTALVFLREVGALDALAYRQLTGCPAKRVARDLAGLRNQGLMIQKGRSRGTYYVPSETLLMSTPQAVMSTARPVMSTPRAENAPPHAETAPARGENAPVPSANTTPLPENTTPRPVTGTPPSVTGTPRPVTGTPPSVTGTPLPVTGTPPSAIGTPEGLISQPQVLVSLRKRALLNMPEALRSRLDSLPKRVPDLDLLHDLIVDLCAWQPLSNGQLAQLLNRNVGYVKKVVLPLVGKRLDYLYPMMVHHPNQAYVAREGAERESGK